ncbi:MAG: GGDEF domain-containing protein, partial [Sulfurimonas sp.]|nr:GGDEF domain-containing protein [Sulfurimonas sp.]
EFADFLLDFIKDSSYQVYRLSGDEFVVWDRVEHINPQKYEKDIDDFFKKLKDFKVEIEGDSVSIDVTIGFSTSQNNAFESAKIALDFAKENNKMYAMYSSAIDKRKDEKDALALRKAIKSAIDNNRVFPVYQPIVDKLGKIVKYEMLVRIKDFNDEFIIPCDFLEFAVKTEHYNKLSSTIFFETLHLLDTSENTFSFNFRYSDIKNSTLLNEIESFFRNSKKLGSRAVFEIVESECKENYEDVKKFVERFRVYGIKIAIDNFGSGFSDFKHILEIEPDYLKINNDLTKNIETDNKSYILVKAIVQFSHDLDVKVIAEHVHNEKIFKMLKEIDVDEYQGVYFSEPLQTIEKKEE